MPVLDGPSHGRLHHRHTEQLNGHLSRTHTVTHRGPPTRTFAWTWTGPHTLRTFTPDLASHRLPLRTPTALRHRSDALTDAGSLACDTHLLREHARDSLPRRAHACHHRPFAPPLRHARAFRLTFCRRDTRACLRTFCALTAHTSSHQLPWTHCLHSQACTPLVYARFTGHSFTLRAHVHVPHPTRLRLRAGLRDAALRCLTHPPRTLRRWTHGRRTRTRVLDAALACDARSACVRAFSPQVLPRCATLFYPDCCRALARARFSPTPGPGRAFSHQFGLAHKDKHWTRVAARTTHPASVIVSGHPPPDFLPTHPAHSFAACWVCLGSIPFAVATFLQFHTRFICARLISRASRRVYPSAFTDDAFALAPHLPHIPVPTPPRRHLPFLFAQTGETRRGTSRGCCPQTLTPLDAAWLPCAHAFSPRANAFRLAHAKDATHLFTTGLPFTGRFRAPFHVAVRCCDARLHLLSPSATHFARTTRLLVCSHTALPHLRALFTARGCWTPFAPHLPTRQLRTSASLPAHGGLRTTQSHIYGRLHHLCWGLRTPRLRRHFTVGCTLPGLGLYTRRLANTRAVPRSRFFSAPFTSLFASVPVRAAARRTHARFTQLRATQGYLAPISRTHTDMRYCGQVVPDHTRHAVWHFVPVATPHLCTRCHTTRTTPSSPLYVHRSPDTRMPFTQFSRDASAAWFATCLTPSRPADTSSRTFDHRLDSCLPLGSLGKDAVSRPRTRYRAQTPPADVSYPARLHRRATTQTAVLSPTAAARHPAVTFALRPPCYTFHRFVWTFHADTCAHYALTGHYTGHSVAYAHARTSRVAFLADGHLLDFRSDSPK